jgi:hypothetical protein
MGGAVGDGPVSLVSFYNLRYFSTLNIIPFVCSVLLKSSQFRLEFVHPAASFLLCFLLCSRICATALALNNGFLVIGILVTVVLSAKSSLLVSMIFTFLNYHSLKFVWLIQWPHNCFGLAFHIMNMLFGMFVGGSTLRIFVILYFIKKFWFLFCFYFLYFLFFGMFVRGSSLIIFVILYFI